MFDVGFAAAGCGARALAALARAEYDVVVVVLGFDTTGIRHEVLLRGSPWDVRADDTVDALVARGVLMTIDMTVDHEHGELFFRCIDHGPANRRVHWTLAYELSADQVLVSSVVKLGLGWERLDAGFRAGLATAPVEHDALPLPFLKISFGPPG